MVTNKEALKQQENTYKINNFFLNKQYINSLIQLRSYTLGFPKILHIRYVCFTRKISNVKRKSEMVANKEALKQQENTYKINNFFKTNNIINLLYN